jgi:asparagine synthase (glutamine-hydrolysing)
MVSRTSDEPLVDFRRHVEWCRPMSPQKAIHPIVRRVKNQRLTYLSFGALNDLFRAAAAADEGSRPGVLVEAGCALGGSAIVLAKAKDRDRALFVHDVFGRIPPPSGADGEDVHARYAEIASGEATGLGGDPYYGYEPELKTKVRQSFERFNLPLADNSVELVEGLFEDTIVGDEPVALAHIDGDWYESVRTCVERLGPRLVKGGVMIVDDYFMWSGCRTAVDEFLAAHPGEYRVFERNRLHIERV